jgi:predicted transcriptional regulator
LSASEVQTLFGGGLAYTTIMTTLSRLHAKHALTRVSDGRAYRYSMPGGAAGAAANVTAHRMLRLLDSDQDRAGVLSRFVADLRPEDEELLAELFARAPE